MKTTPIYRLNNGGCWVPWPVVFFTRQFGSRFAICPSLCGRGYEAFNVATGFRTHGTLSKTPRACLRDLNFYLNRIPQIPWWDVMNNAGLPLKSRRGEYTSFLAGYMGGKYGRKPE